jgi:hypothetical protein
MNRPYRHLIGLVSAGTTGVPLQFLCQVRDPTLDNPNLIRSRTTGRIQHVHTCKSGGFKGSDESHA